MKRARWIFHYSSLHYYTTQNSWFATWTQCCKMIRFYMVIIPSSIKSNLRQITWLSYTKKTFYSVTQEIFNFQPYNHCKYFVTPIEITFSSYVPLKMALMEFVLCKQTKRKTNVSWMSIRYLFLMMYPVTVKQKCSKKVIIISIQRMKFSKLHFIPLVFFFFKGKLKVVRFLQFQLGASKTSQSDLNLDL